MMVTDDSMSDDVFEAETTETSLQPQYPPLAPSPTGYKDYRPPEDVLRHVTSSANPSNRLNYLSSNQIQINQAYYEAQEKIHKTILLGDSGVGKTSLLVQFNTKQFQSGNFAATVGIGFTNKIVSVDAKQVKLQIWDTAGQERFRSVTHAYYRDAHALLLLYDIANKLSFDNIRAWLGEIKEYAQDDVVIMLLGNKCDCDRERVISKEQGQRLAREYNVGFMETSAKTGLNVDLAFNTIARDLTSKKEEEKVESEDASRFSVQDYLQDHASRASNCPPCQT